MKHVVNDNGGDAAAGDFTMSVTATNPSRSSFPGDEAGTTITVEPGAYTVAESGPTGYAASFSLDCEGTIALGETKTCTVTNDDIAGSLTVNKVVAPSSDTGRFNLQIDGVTAGTGTNVGDGGSTGAVPVNAGAHTVSETAGTATVLSHYVTTIGGDCGADGTISLALAESKTCTITNTRRATLTVVKTENGAPPTSPWSFRVTGGPDSVSITRTTTVHDVPLNSGNLDFGLLASGSGYTLCELAVPSTVTSTLASSPGATVDPATGNVCVSFSLAAGESRSFTVDNTYSDVSRLTAGGTCQQFSSGTAPALPTLASGGQLEYALKANRISQVNPGVFTYWVKVTAGAGSKSIVIDQSISSGNFSRPIGIASGQQVFSAGCTAVQGATISQTNGDVTVTWPAGTGGVFYIGVKYSGGSLVNAPRPSPGTNVDFQFQTTGVLGSTEGLRLSSKK